MITIINPIHTEPELTSEQLYYNKKGDYDYGKMGM